MWIYLRHYLNLHILYSVLVEFRAAGPYELDWRTEQFRCWVSNAVCLGLLVGLQVLNLFWLYCLLRSAYRFVVHNVAKDDRSEAEDTELEELDAEHRGGGVDTPPLVDGDGDYDDSADGVVKATGSAAAQFPVTKRNGAL